MKFASYKSLQAHTILAFFVSITIGGYYGLFLQIQNNMESSAGLVDEIKKAKQREIQLTSMGTLIKESRTDIEKLDIYLVVGGGGVVNFIETIESIGGISGVNVTVNTVETEKNKIHETLEDLNLNLTVRGTWNSVFHFIALVETLPQHVEISGAQFNRVPTDEEEFFWQGTLDISAIKLK